MKTKEELEELKKEVAALNEKLAELSEEELKQVTGGIATVYLGLGYTAEYLSDGSERIKVTHIL